MEVLRCAATVSPPEGETSQKTNNLYPEQDMRNPEVLTQFAEEHASSYLESNRIPDPYYFEFDKAGKLISPNTKAPIEDVVVKDNPLGRVEYEAFKIIQKEAEKRSNGYILWLSPSYPGFYPVSKIIISEIVFEEEKKKLLNRAIITDWDSLGSIIAARELSLLSSLNQVIFKTQKDVRANPIFVSKEDEGSLSLALGRILDKNSIEMVAAGTDLVEKKKFMDAYAVGRIMPHGSFPLSCPERMVGQTAFQVFSGEKRIFCCTCPKCNKQVEAEIYGGKIHCPKCGAEAERKN